MESLSGGIFHQYFWGSFCVLPAKNNPAKIKLCRVDGGFSPRHKQFVSLALGLKPSPGAD
jgi:hypothetical protein